MSPVVTTIYPHWNGMLYLEDFKIQLGRLGVEQMNPLEAYFYGIWGRHLWNEPLRVDYVRQKFLFRYAGVEDTPFLNEYLQFLL